MFVRVYRLARDSDPVFPAVHGCLAEPRNSFLERTLRLSPITKGLWRHWLPQSIDTKDFMPRVRQKNSRAAQVPKEPGEFPQDDRVAGLEDADEITTRGCPRSLCWDLGHPATESVFYHWVKCNLKVARSLRLIKGTDGYKLEAGTRFSAINSLAAFRPVRMQSGIPIPS